MILVLVPNDTVCISAYFNKIFGGYRGGSPTAVQA